VLRRATSGQASSMSRCPASAFHWRAKLSNCSLTAGIVAASAAASHAAARCRYSSDFWPATAPPLLGLSLGRPTHEHSRANGNRCLGLIVPRDRSITIAPYSLVRSAVSRRHRNQSGSSALCCHAHTRDRRCRSPLLVEPSRDHNAAQTPARPPAGTGRGSRRREARRLRRDDGKQGQSREQDGL